MVKMYKLYNHQNKTSENKVLVKECNPLSVGKDITGTRATLKSEKYTLEIT